MNNDDKETPRIEKRNGPKGPGIQGYKKAKDFKSALKRILKELKDFKILIIVALILAVLSSALSIFTPNILSDLTDEISSGLVMNVDNFKKISKEVTTSLNENISNNKITDILELNISNDNIMEILNNDKISNEDKNSFQQILTSINGETDKTKILSYISSLPDSILNIIITDSVYDGVNITFNDKVEFIKLMSGEKNNDFPESIANILFKDITIDGVTINSIDQSVFLIALNGMDENVDTKILYSLVDTMPSSIKKLIEPKIDLKAVKTIALTLTILYLLSALFNYIEAISMTNVANNFARSLRNRISTKINKLPLKYFDSHTNGDILSRVTNDVDTVAQTLNQSLATLVSSLVLFIGTIIMMFITNWILALTAIGASLFGFIFMFIVLSKSQKYFVSKQKELGNLNGHIEEIYSSLNVVKAYNGKYESDTKFDKFNNKVATANLKSQFLSGLMMPLMNFIGNFGYVAVCVVGALLAMNGKITFGVIVAFITYVRLFTSPLSQIAQAMTSLQSAGAASERIFEFTDETEMPKENNLRKKLSRDKIKGNVEFRNVVFKYDGNDKPTIKGFNASITKGQKVAIVGPTGAGKTTMVNLLMKFYDIDSGDILIDGVSTHDLTRENIHDLFTMVLQDTWLFSGTLKENIIYNRENVTNEDIDKVCKTVGLDHFIKSLSSGYETDITDNDSVSSGQRQLITLARGMVEGAPLLILDEATSNVDTRTEELVQTAMDKLTEGRTSFIIAHRLSTIKNADLILVMKDGNIIEQGNHNKLMKMNGFYAELYNSQFRN